MYLLCGLDDEYYARPYFESFPKMEDAITQAVNVCCDHIEDELVIEISKDRSRIETKDCDNYYVNEILEYDETKGSHILVFHHAYHGIGFEIKFIGDYYECKREMDRLVEESLDIVDSVLEWNEDFQACVDTGIEWEIFSIVEVR